MNVISKVFIIRIVILCMSLQLCFFYASATVRLPKLINDGMVLQRDTELKIWGWASPDESVKLNFRGQNYTIRANSEGSWHILLPPQQAGGPYEMTINTIAIKDILIGDVWLCSGQSNMELPISRVLDLYKNEIDSTNNPYIRHFKVPLKYSFTKQEVDQAGGEWKSAISGDILSISALTYFFANELYNKYKIAIGLLNVSVGGSPIEAWMSKDALKNTPHYLAIAKQYAQAHYVDSIQNAEKRAGNKWYDTLNRMDKGRQSYPVWSGSEVDTSGWSTMTVPGYWANQLSDNSNGSVWFRKTFTLPFSANQQEAKLRLGCIVDSDSVYINGTFVGTTSYQYPPRIYNVPKGLLKAGENNIAIRVVNTTGKGGFVEDKPYKLIVGDSEFNLSGAWLYKWGAKMPSLQSPTFFQYKPTALYNGMQASVNDYKIKGALWYQGESNTSRADEYENLLVSLIHDWRKKRNSSFPFLYVQLPNFMKSDTVPSESAWAMLREAQLNTLKVSNTGMAVAIDAGEWNDIHPLNKKDIGRRLSLLAQKLAYHDQTVVSSGPLYRSMEIKDNRIVISFRDIGSGLLLKGTPPKGFAIAGADRRFVWANVRIEGDQLIVWSDSIKHPLAVRYAWANNPDNAGLYNKEGLPASPFRTDKW